LTVGELEEDLGIPRTIVSQKRVAAKFVPRLLSREQKEFYAAVAQDLIETANNDPDFLKKVITGDESWVYGYDPETKAQSSQWKLPESPRLKKARQIQSNVMVMLTVFFHHEGVVHHKYAPPGHTITKDYYIEFLRRLRDAVRRKRLWASGDWHLHQDNAPAHSSALVQTFLVKHRITQVSQPPYSPDLAPCDFWLFSKLKLPLKWRRFQTANEIKENVMRQLMAIPKKDFSGCFEKCKGTLG